jgi:hypothetical protein
MTNFEEVVVMENLEKPRVLIYDLDGTVVDSSVRSRRHIDLAAKARGDFEVFRASLDAYNQSCLHDVAIPAGIQVISGLSLAFGATPIAVTSRGEIGRIPTLAWLKEHMPWEVHDSWLFMRPEVSDDPTGWLALATTEALKEFRLRELRERFTVCAAVDDHQGVCEMYQAQGVPSVHVLYPGIDCLTPGGEWMRKPQRPVFNLPPAGTGVRSLDRVGPI